MDGDNPIADLCETAVHILDKAMGRRMCGSVVSGAVIPGFRGIRDRESPFNLTQRALVHPMMDRLGYGCPRYDLDSIGRCEGTILAMVPMNRPVDEPLDQILMFIRGHGQCRGLATNGFLWVLSEQDDRGGLSVLTVDLRPFYVEALDRDRFKTSVSEGPEEAQRFLRAFGRH